MTRIVIAIVAACAALTIVSTASAGLPYEVYEVVAATGQKQGTVDCVTTLTGDAWAAPTGTRTTCNCISGVSASR